jgi:2-hydroxy-3-keto-5-methylthiopentenyl-1-phosphate phosphatase
MPTRRKAAHAEAPALNPVIFCDFDGTITQLDVTDQILTQLAHPFWREIEQEWVCGSIGSRECLERQMALVDASAEDLNALIDEVPVDPDFSRFLRLVERHSLPFYVVSDGFDYVVRRVLKRAGLNGRLRNGTHLFASALRVEGRRLVVSFPHSATLCEHGCATCKADIMGRLREGRSPLVFIGDGLSDRFAVRQADLVFAKRQLLAYCRENGVECQPFETFADVESGLEKIIAKAGRRGGRASVPRR